MAISDQQVTSQVASFTGLDQETVSSQIVPYLKTITSASALRHHLVDLIGPGAAQASFLDTYVASRFPPAPAPAPTPALAAPAPRKPVAATSSKHAAAKSSTSASASSSRAPTPVDLSKAFGSSGAVYRKDHDGLQAQGRHGSSGNNPRSRPQSQSTTPQRALSPPRPAAAAMSAQPSATSSSSAAPASSFTLVPTEEMKMLDAEIAQLTGGSQSSEQSSSGSKKPKQKRRVCFCQGRIHPLFPRNPLCSKCGLLLCSLTLPTPLHPSSTCPSCQATLFTESDRSNLLSDLVTRREEAERRELLRIEHLRVERDKARNDKANASEDRLFPELAGGDAKARERARQRDLALGRGGSGSSEPERKSRVLTIGKKGKVTVGSSKPKKKPATTAPEASQTTASEPTEEPIEDEAPDEEAEAAALAAEEEEEALRLGLVHDLDDDGYREGQDLATSASSVLSVKHRPLFNPFMSFQHQEEEEEDSVDPLVSLANHFRYVPRSERVAIIAEDEDADGADRDENKEAVTAEPSLSKKKTVPGAAEESKGGNSRRKGNKKKQAN